MPVGTPSRLAAGAQNHPGGKGGSHWHSGRSAAFFSQSASRSARFSSSVGSPSRLSIYENAVTFARVNPQRMDLIHRAVGVVNDEVCTPEEHALIEAEREARKRGKKKKPNQVRPKDDGPAVLGNARK